eukprot:scaffold756_cov158-Amphora_coffeaeformis.AAC.6
MASMNGSQLMARFDLNLLRPSDEGSDVTKQSKRRRDLIRTNQIHSRVRASIPRRRNLKRTNQNVR